MQSRFGKCILVHGFMGTADEMLPLKAPLEKLGLATELVTLPGHDSSVEEFMQSSYQQWLEHLDAVYQRACQEYDRILLIGFSMGGSLALHLAQKYAPVGLITIATIAMTPKLHPRHLRDLYILALPLVQYFKKEIKIHSHRSPEAAIISPWRGYEGAVYPRQLCSLFNGLRDMRKGLAKVSAPLLVIHDARDKLAPPENVFKIISGVSSEDFRVEITTIRENITARHRITTHREVREQIINSVCEFAVKVFGIST